jgi:redox-sensitive bicupin YhaK (pirin superfamily)
LPGTVERFIRPRERDLGGFTVRRVLPYAARRMVGPFIFLDHMGPTRFPEGKGVDVRPHPHIGLATVTYLFEGEIVHRDSLGFVQPIRPGDVNWMTAGRGIVHSERTALEEKAKGPRLHGIQSWVALPKAHEETAPAFHHHPAAALPVIEIPGGTVRVVAGGIDGTASPVVTFSDMLYLDTTLSEGARLALPASLGERALYVVEGTLAIGDTAVAPTEMAVLADGADVTVTAAQDTRAIAIGGSKLEGERHIWWNLVSSSRDRIERAKADWKGNRFARVPGDDEFIPLPEE